MHDAFWSLQRFLLHVLPIKRIFYGQWNMDITVKYRQFSLGPILHVHQIFILGIKIFTENICHANCALYYRFIRYWFKNYKHVFKRLIRLFAHEVLLVEFSFQPPDNFVLMSRIFIESFVRGTSRILFDTFFMIFGAVRGIMSFRESWTSFISIQLTTLSLRYLSPLYIPSTGFCILIIMATKYRYTSI